MSANWQKRRTRAAHGRTSCPHTGRGSGTELVLWLLAVQAIALAGFPLMARIFRPLPDSGYLLGKALSLLIVAYLAWLGAALQIIPFSRMSVLAAILILAAASAFVAYKSRRELINLIRLRWRWLLTAEALFIAVFLLLAPPASRQPGPLAPVPWRREANGCLLPHCRHTFVVHAALRSMVRRRLLELLLLRSFHSRDNHQAHGNRAGIRRQPCHPHLLDNDLLRRLFHRREPCRSNNAATPNLPIPGHRSARCRSVSPPSWSPSQAISTALFRSQNVSARRHGTR